MTKKVKYARSIVGFRLAMIFAVAGAFISFGGELSFALILAGCAAACLAVYLSPIISRKKLKRLTETGVAYNTGDIEYERARFLRLRGYAVGRFFFSYVDDRGMEHITKIYCFAIKIDYKNVSIEPLDAYIYDAKIYVNPENPDDYAVDFTAKGA